MDELSNPFRPGTCTRPPALLGRDELIDHFGYAVRRALAGSAKSYAERLFEFPVIGSPNPDGAIAALQIPVQEVDVDYTHAALEAIISRAHGYPNFLQEWGYHTWNQAEANPIEADLVERVVPDVVHHIEEAFFLVRFDRRIPAEKTYLRAMA